MQQATPAGRQRIQEMLDDLNSLLAAPRRRAGHRRSSSPSSWTSTASSSRRTRRPSTSWSTCWPQRSAAAQRMMQLDVRRAARRAGRTGQQAFGDPRLGAVARRSWTRSCRACGRARTGPVPGRFRGDSPMGLGEATRAMEELGRLEQLAEQLAQSYPGAAAGRHRPRRARGRAGRAGPGRRRRTGRAGTRAARAGPLRAGARRVAAAVPKALRRLGESALRDVVDRIGGRRGERETRRSGAAGEPTGASRPWAFGDTEPWNVPRTLLNAALRRAAGDDRAAGRRRRGDRRDRAAARGPRSRCASTRRGRWCRTGAGCR